jgi:hypothetical protein
MAGGETGIRTLGTREGSTVFETAPFDHSGTSPRGQARRTLATQVAQGVIRAPVDNRVNVSWPSGDAVLA